jgi:hypothetical protein
MQILKRIILIVLILIVVGCLTILISEIIYAHSIDKIELVEVDHPYIGKKISSTLLDKSHYFDFVFHFDCRRPELFIKFYSCYVITIHFKNGQIRYFRTNGRVIEILNHKVLFFGTYRLLGKENIITRYWKIPENEQCKKYLIENY